jgi:hypothetical protein
VGRKIWVGAALAGNNVTGRRAGKDINTTDTIYLITDFAEGFNEGIGMFRLAGSDADAVV